MTLSFVRRSALLAAGCLLATAAWPALAQDRAALMEQHRGGTMRLVARAAAGTIDPHINYTLQYWQLYQFVYDGLLAFKKAPGAEGFAIVPDLAEAIPEADRRRQVLHLQAAPGDQVLRRQRPRRRRRRGLVPAHLQGGEPDLRLVLQRHRRRRRLPRHAGHLHARGRRRGRCRRRHRHHQPDPAGSGILLQAGPAARRHPAGRGPGHGRRHRRRSPAPAPTRSRATTPTPP